LAQSSPELMRKSVLAGCACVWALLLPAPLSAAAGNAVPLLERKVAGNPQDVFAWTRLAGLCLEELRGTGDLALLAKAQHAAEMATLDVDPRFTPGGLAARGQVELAGHRFTAARATALEYCGIRGDKSTGWLLLGDAELEMGNYPEAEKAFAKMEQLDDEPTVAALTRRAKLDLVHGRRAKAREHLEAALAMLQKLDQPAPPVEAWIHVQLGELAFGQGEWEAAEKQYTAALSTIPGWYPAEEHLAELRGAQGRTEEAVAAYQKLLAGVERPDLCQALGDLYAFTNQRDLAQPWHAKAAAAYRRSADAGEILFLHHASGFFTDSAPEPTEALKLAQRDLEGRHSIYGWDSLAWAQYAKGDLKEAAVSIEKALSTGVREAHILYHAGMIRMSLGDLTGGRAALQQTVEINPRYATFHVHR
jgi:tetratricopeptide (TPR) repeat protein